MPDGIDLNSEELKSGECWTCQADYLTLRGLNFHIKHQHNRYPYTSDRRKLIAFAAGRVVEP